MPVLTPDTKEEQDKAYDPAEERYDREFNGGGNKTASDLQERENQAGNNADDFAKWDREMEEGSSRDKSQKPPTDNIDNAKAGEASGGWRNNTTAQPSRGEKIGALLKGGLIKKGPLGIIAAILFGGGAGLGFFGFTLMPITIAEQFTNDTNDANASSQHKTIRIVGKKLGGDVKKKMSICNSVVSIRCKFKTLDGDLVKKFEEKGFKFGDKTVDGDRVGFSNIEFPDGQIARTVQEFEAIMSNSTIAASVFNAVINLKNSIFLLGGFFKNVLKGMGLGKGKKIEGKTKKDADKSFEESTKGEKTGISTSAVPDKPGDDASEEAKKNSQAANEGATETERTINDAISKGKKLKKLSLKITNALAVPQLLCLSFNMASFIAIMAKTKKLLRFAAFAMIFLTLASSIKANAATEPEVEKAMGVLAPSKYPDKVEDENGDMVDNPNIGKNALDAEAYKVVAYGDQINLTGIATRFFVASGFLGVLEKVVKWVDQNIGKRNVKTACKIVNSTVATVISFIAAPILGAAMYGIMSILPIDEWAADLVNLAIDAAAGLDLTNGIIGVDAGNVLFIGAAAIMGTMAQKFGMKPGKLAAIRKNMGDNHQLLQKEIAMKTYEASKTPFDITNRYSFLGSMSFQMANLMPSMQKPVVSSVGKVLSAIPTSFNMLTKNASAAYSMPVSDYSETRFKQCNDEQYQAMKIDPDMFCAVRYTPFDYADSDDVLDYMEAHAEIETNGKPKPGTYLEKYTKYCVNREDPWGSTSVPAEEQNDDTRWYTGEMCVDETEENRMASEYTGYKATQGILDNEDESEATQNPATGSVITGDLKELAQKVIDSPDIQFVNTNTETDLASIVAGTPPVFNSCDNPMVLDPALLGTMLALTNRYKILVNNIGFNNDRSFCDSGQHPKGAAVDINGIEVKGGAKTSWGSISYTPQEVPIITAYANDWLAVLAPNRGGVGQKGCGGFSVTPPPGATGINGNLHFTDACNHLHIDVRTR
jgi:hypothetical protein